MNHTTKDEEVRKLILESARKVFQKWGLNKTTMEDIAKEAGKGKSTLYYYYKSKEDIFEVIALEEMDLIVSKAKNAVENIHSFREKIIKYITTILYELRETISLYPLVKGEIKANREFIDKIQLKIKKKEDFVLSELLRGGIKSGEINFINEENLEKTASVINELIKGLVTFLILENEDSEKLDIALKLITEGL